MAWERSVMNSCKVSSSLAKAIPVEQSSAAESNSWLARLCPLTVEVLVNSVRAPVVELI